MNLGLNLHNVRRVVDPPAEENDYRVDDRPHLPG